MRSRLLVAILFSICLSTLSASVNAASIFVSGDTTPVYELIRDEDNQQFFSNILGSSSQVTVLRSTNNYLISSIAHDFYNSLTGVNSTFLSDAITTTNLQNTDLLFISAPDDEFSTSELSAINNLLQSGGSVFFLGEAQAISYGSTTNSIINSGLAALGSELSLITMDLDLGPHDATGEQIIAHSLTTGVTAFHYGASSEVNGGVELFLAQNGAAIIAYEDVVVVPLPSALFLFGSGLLGLVVITKRNKMEHNKSSNLTGAKDAPSS